MKTARLGQADLSKWFPLAAGLAALTLTLLPLAVFASGAVVFVRRKWQQ